MKLKELDMHCSNCVDRITHLCNKYTPYDNCEIPICEQSSIENLDIEKDIEEIEKFCLENFKV